MFSHFFLIESEPDCALYLSCKWKDKACHPLNLSSVLGIAFYLQVKSSPVSLFIFKAGM